MDRDLAERVVRKIEEFATWFNDFSALSTELEVVEVKQIRRVLADMLRALDDGVEEKMRKEHPDLFTD